MPRVSKKNASNFDPVAAGGSSRLPTDWPQRGLFIMRNDTTYCPTRTRAKCAGTGVVGMVGVLAWKADRFAGSRVDAIRTAPQPIPVAS